MSGSTKYCHLLHPLSLPRRKGLSSHLIAVAPEHQRDGGTCRRPRWWRVREREQQGKWLPLTAAPREVMEASTPTPNPSPKFQLQSLLPQSSPPGCIMGTSVCSNHQNWCCWHPAHSWAWLHWNVRPDVMDSKVQVLSVLLPRSPLHPLLVNQMPGSPWNSSVHFFHSDLTPHL